MVKPIGKATRFRTEAKRRPRPRVNGTKENPKEDERILRAATLHLITMHGMFLVATDLRQARVKGLRVWIITVTLRYAAGHEGYIGDLLYDGEEFTFLTPPEIRKERAKQIANDPEGVRKWNEHRDSVLRPGKA